MKPNIVLTMIVKNEEHVIERALNSCYTMIDSYCIVDTGSTDNTKEKIKNFFDSKNISGKIVDFEFTNFEECRNVSITEGKELGDYGFWMDADEQLFLDKNFNKQLFKQFLITNKPDQLQLKCKYGAIKYHRSQFYKFDTGYYWYGPVHEILKCDKQTKTMEFPFGYALITPDGNSWVSGDLSKKYQEHAEILLKYQEENNWEDSRWTFYLAQSYKDAGTIRLERDVKDELGIDLVKKAIKYFEKRISQTNGFYQEIYYSQLMIYRLNAHPALDNFDISLLLKCEELNVDNRVEHLFNLVSYLQNNRMHKNALMYLQKALKYLKEGCRSSLFVEEFIYDWAIYDMYGVSLANTGKYKEAKKYFNYSLKKAKDAESGDTNIKRIENNIKSVEINIRKQDISTGKGTIKI